MNSGTLKMTGLAGLVWGVLVLVAYLAIFVFVGRAVSGGTGGTIIVQILALVAALAFIVMMFLLSQQIASSIGKIACYAAIVLQIVVVLFQFIQMQSAGLALVILILLGISIVLVGVFSVMMGGSGPWKAFAILLIVAGALKIIIVGEVIYPFVACAAGVMLFIAMNKRAAA
jgi:hypothetical protein